MAAIDDGSASVGAWPTPAISTSFDPGSTRHIRAAVSGARMSLSAPRITIVRAVIRA